MEEIARNIEKLIETLNENSIPNWITIVGLLGPVFISILVCWLSNRQNKTIKRKKNNYFIYKIERIMFISIADFIYTSRIKLLPLILIRSLTR